MKIGCWELQQFCEGVEATLSLLIGAVQEKRVFPSHYGFLDLAVSLGLKWVEFKYEERLDRDGTMRYGAGTRLGEYAAANNIEVSVHAAFDDGINLGTKNKELLHITRRRVRESVDFAERVNAKYLTVHGGFYSLGYALTPRSENLLPPFQQVREELGGKEFAGLKTRIYQEIGALREYAKQRGVVVALENLHGFSYDRTRFPVTPQDFFECQAALGDDLPLVYDSGHANSTGLTASEFILAVGLNNIVGAHIHDNDGTDDQHLSLGEGNIDFPQFFLDYVENGAAFPLNFELRFKKHFIESKKFVEGLKK